MKIKIVIHPAEEGATGQKSRPCPAVTPRGKRWKKCGRTSGKPSPATWMQRRPRLFPRGQRLKKWKYEGGIGTPILQGFGTSWVDSRPHARPSSAV